MSEGTKRYELVAKYIFDDYIDIEATEEECVEYMKETLQQEFSEDPVGFFEKLQVNIKRKS
jgi:hypothetical protein